MGKHIVVAGPWMGCDAGLSVFVPVLYRMLVERVPPKAQCCCCCRLFSGAPVCQAYYLCYIVGDSVTGVEAIPRANVPSS